MGNVLTSLTGTETVNLTGGDRVNVQTLANLGHSGTITTAVVNLTSAQLKTLSSNPPTIIAAPGANKMILLLNAVSYYIYGTTPYTGASVSPILLYNSNTLVKAVGDFFNGFQFTRSQIQIVNQIDDNENIDLYLNQPVTLHDTADWAGGDGTAKIFVSYVIIDFS